MPPSPSSVVMVYEPPHRSPRRSPLCGGSSLVTISRIISIQVDDRRRAYTKPRHRNAGDATADHDSSGPAVIEHDPTGPRAPPGGDDRRVCALKGPTRRVTFVRERT